MSDPDWSLIKHITRAAADPRWGGGVRRGHLAELVCLGPRSKALNQAIGVAARLRRTDFCYGYVVPGKPEPGSTGRRAA